MIASAPAYRLRELVAYRELVANLTIRDLKLKYKRSVLGAAWSLLNPLIMMGIYTAIFSVFLRVTSLSKPYWAFVLIGLLAWLFFANALGSATTSLVYNSTLISKVYFPLESLTISTVLSNFVNFVISLIALLAILLLAGFSPAPSLVLLPVVVLAQLSLTVGLGLLIACLTVYFRDLEHLVGLGLTALFYLTPVLYPLDTRFLPHGAGRFVNVLRLNPISWYIDSYHSILFFGHWPDPLLFTLMLVSATLALVAGYGTFLKLRPRLPEEV